jgi:hypothetical protein
MTQARERYRPERDKTSKWGIIIDYNMDPLFRPFVFVALYYIVGLICMIVCFVLPSDGKSTQPLDYGSQISLGKSGTIDILVQEDLPAPVYLYYRLSDFHQNHRSFVRSLNVKQLMYPGYPSNGPDTSFACSVFGSCRPEDPEAHNKLEGEASPQRMGRCVFGADRRFILTPTSDGSGVPLFPCGLSASLAFNDSFQLALVSPNDGSLRQLDLDESPEAISFFGDRKKFVNNLLPSEWEERMDMWMTPVFPPASCRYKLGAWPAPGGPERDAVFVRWGRNAVGTTNTRCAYGDEVLAGLQAGPYGGQTCEYGTLVNSQWKDGQQPSWVSDASAPPVDVVPRDLDNIDVVPVVCEGDLEEVQNTRKKGPGWGMSSSHFMNWMRNAGMPSFSKLYGVLDADTLPGGRIPAGTTIRVLVNNLYPTELFDGKKSIFLATTATFGPPKLEDHLHYNFLRPLVEVFEVRLVLITCGVACTVLGTGVLVWSLIQGQAWERKIANLDVVFD